MKKHVLMITDRSGSMRPLRNDVIGGQNGYLDDLAADGLNAASYRFTQVLFNTAVETLDEAADLNQVIRFDQHNYRPEGGTALLDAIGQTVTLFLETTKAKVNEGDKVLLIIQTDGEENSSREWTKRGVRDLLDSVQKDHGWAVVFSGAGPDGWHERDALGAGKFSTMHTNSATGTRAAYSSYAGATRNWAGGQTMGSAEVAEDVQRGIDEQGGNA